MQRLQFPSLPFFIFFFSLFFPSCLTNSRFIRPSTARIGDKARRYMQPPIPRSLREKEKMRKGYGSYGEVRDPCDYRPQESDDEKPHFGCPWDVPKIGCLGPEDTCASMALWQTWQSSEYIYVGDTLGSPNTSILTLVDPE
eukprot:392617-Amorphochlora_amoeboformis.AAC.1